MRTTNIKIGDLEQYMRLEREYQRLAVGLLHYKTMMESMLKVQQDIAKTAKLLVDFKDTPWWYSLTPEQR